jgi:hypothetical protein
MTEGANCHKEARSAGTAKKEILIFGQFTRLDFTGRLETEGIRISMDGRGRVFDNIFIERL